MFSGYKMRFAVFKGHWGVSYESQVIQQQKTQWWYVDDDNDDDDDDDEHRRYELSREAQPGNSETWHNLGRKI